MTLAHHRLGSGAPLVLIHGIGSEWRAWEPVLERLARERDVIAVDLPGFGGSAPLPAGVEPTAAAFARAVAAFLDRLGLAEVHVAGNSLGGWVALEVGRLGRAASVTALSPAGFWSRPEQLRTQANLRAARLAARWLGFAAGPLLSTFVGRAVLMRQMLQRPWRMPADAAVRASRSFAACPGWDATLERLAAPDSRFERGEELRCPVTIAWAEHDRILLPVQAMRAAEALPRARSIPLRGCGHAPMWDDPEQVARLLLEGSAAARG